MADRVKQLRSMVGNLAEPTLTDQDLATLLELHASADAEGRLPTTPEWTPTYRMRAAAAEGWRWKAARASELISTDLDGDRMSADQIFEHCQRMAASYAAAGSTSTADR